ncbi:HpcH/HpaI aldolase/citrate lyase family protein [Halomonas sp. HNIBRBA4712]|uniref:HpcH/HpaI aldolase family protein n=1 Tax=Halomonas sp. HNIBRBA4712 TaxID=3373087 RepID=UPI0037464CA8
MSKPKLSIWLTEPSTAAVEIAQLAGYDTIVLDVEHGLFDLAAMDWLIPSIRARGMRVIVKVLGPERGPIQQALDFGANGVAIPHIESAEHAQQVCGYAKFPPLGDRSFAGGRVSSYRGFSDNWLTTQDTEYQCFPMIEDGSAFDSVEEILALECVDGIFIGPSDLSMRRGRGAYSVSEDDLDDIRYLARAACKANKPWILPAWSEAERQVAIDEKAATIVLTMQYGALLNGFSQALTDFKKMEEETR